MQVRICSTMFTLIIMNSTNNSLRYLDLSVNRIGEKGGVEIARALQHSPPITWLSLNNNNLNDRVGEALVQALKRNTTILVMQIELNNITYKVFICIMINKI